ncbi:hypothetical protein D3C86_2070850 [compost metagenome]
MINPPSATPNGLPLSINTAPRLRSLGASHKEISLPPDGNNGASAAPSATRANNSDKPPVANAASTWKVPHNPVDQLMTRCGPKRSINQPPGICNNA